MDDPQQALREQAAALLMLIWRGIPTDYKSRYRKTIWEQFENQIQSAAYTSNLGKFANSLCSKLDVAIGRNAEDRAAAARILNSGQDRALLRLMREETALIVLMVHLANQERRDTFEAMENFGEDE